MRTAATGREVEFIYRNSTDSYNVLKNVKKEKVRFDSYIIGIIGRVWDYLYTYLP